MKKCFFATLLVLFVAGLVHAKPTLDPWADEVVLFDQPDGSNHFSGADDPANALGANDGKCVAVDIPEVLILKFSDNVIYDGEGNDIYVYQWVAGDSSIDIFGSSNNNSYSYLGSTRGNAYFDLADYPELNTLSYIKFVGVDNGGTAPGYDLDAVKGLNNQPVNSCPTVPAPGAAALAMIGIGCVRYFRRKHAD